MSPKVLTLDGLNYWENAITVTKTNSKTGSFEKMKNYVSLNEPFENSIFHR